jgi:hypothetical protein
VPKCLDYYDDDLPIPAASTLPPDGVGVTEEVDFAPLLDLPDPDVSASASTVASDDSSATGVRFHRDSYDQIASEFCL